MKSQPDQRLTDEQVRNLLEEYSATKDLELRDQIVLQYKNLVESIARRFMGSGEPLEDLVQEGYIGLITATDLYDAAKGVKFSTYSTHFIIGQIKHALRDRGKIIKEPAWLQELNHRITRVMDSLYQELGRQPTNREIGKIMHLPEETIADMLTTREIFKVASLDCDQEDMLTGGLDVDKVKDDKYTTFQLPVEDRIVLEMAVNKLKLIEQKVINEFYFNDLSQTEIAKKLGISCNYVSHILRSGTRKLRRIITTEEIREVQMQLQLANHRSEYLNAGARPMVIDSITGLYGAAYMEDRLAEEVTRAARDKSEIAFAVISVPVLEEFGKQYGRAHLDNTLCELAELVKDDIRKCDIAGRMGDYDFGLILLHTNQQADRVCERVRAAIRDLQVDIGASRGCVTFNPDIGYAVYPTDATQAADLMKLAWEALEQDRTRKLKDAA